MRSIYVLLTHTGTYISKTIRVFTKAKYTHASISFEDGLQPLYSFSRKYVYLVLPGELHNEPLETGFFKRHSNIPCAVYEVKVSEEVYQKAKAVVNDMLTDDVNYKFSVLGLLPCGLQIPHNRRRHYFCSEFVSKVLDESGALELPKEKSLMRPNDYTSVPNLNCIYEGKLNELIAQNKLKLSV